VETASDKAEYAARFMRTKIKRLVDQYLEELPETPLNRSSLNIRINGESFSSPEALAAKLKVDTSVKPVGEKFRGGTSQAIRRFDLFITSRLMQYKNNRNQPQTDDVSHMGMYLHFGQISPVFLGRKIRQVKKINSEIIDAFLEELIVRRELAINYVFYTDQYDSYDGLPKWAQTTLNQHAADPREYVYSQIVLEEAKTHDPYWNAAQNEMKYSGYMHNYMRMYWVKKILEWSKSPQYAFETAIYLNNKYFIDGRDPNSYAGVSWGFGLHDRPWKERPIFGKVRYMNAAGLRRKCDIGAYVEKINRMVR
jgi:deoxyribodipyrimidine photo-lyase